MDPFGIIVVFIILWWIAFFVTLPFGIETPKTQEPGHAPGAPNRPRLWIKAGVATLAAGALTGLVAGLVASGWLSFETFAP